MAVAKQHNSFSRLKKKVRKLHRKEENSRKKLRDAIKKIRQLGQDYKSKLAGNVRLVTAKVAVQSSNYTKIVTELERRMLKNIETKGKALSLAVARLEKLFKTKQSSIKSKKAKHPVKAKVAKTTYKRKRKKS